MKEGNEKHCVKCGEDKDISEFGKNYRCKDGISNRCKECEKQRAKEYRLNNPEKQKESSKKWRMSHPDKQRECIQNYVKKNPHMCSTLRSRERRKDKEYIKRLNEKRREYYNQNKDKLREERRKYYFKNKSKERMKNNEWKGNKRKSDPIFRIKLNIRARIRECLKGGKISKRTFEIIGINSEDFKYYIESKFMDGMTWENYGEWHIDHIKPLFMAKSEEEVLLYNYYTNLQPLWAGDNLKKNRKYGN